MKIILTVLLILSVAGEAHAMGWMGGGGGNGGGTSSNVSARNSGGGNTQGNQGGSKGTIYYSYNDTNGGNGPVSVPETPVLILLGSALCSIAALKKLQK
ncbi:MAG TPA: hypothetical protein VLS90_10610 [Thermodesulfobacteriota bacterium]|nr:hypothetical protein [Thermodesulfobacteriota bacterium]